MDGDEQTKPIGGLARSETVWRNGSFLLLWAAYGVSAFGDHLSEMGLWNLMGADHSDRQIQLMARMSFAFFVPYVFLGPVAGLIADRFNKRRVMIAADLVRAAIVLSILPMTQWLTNGPLKMDIAWAALVPLVMVGTFATFFSPARMALLPRLVTDSQLTQANSLCNGVGIFASMISYVVGGYLAVWSLKWNFRLDAMTFAASAAMIFLITMPHRRTYEHAKRGKAMSLRWGVHYLRDHGRVRLLIVVATLFWTASATFNCTVPAVVSHRYKMGIEELSWFRGAMGAGMVIGAILLSWVRDALRASTVITWTLLGAAGMLVGFALADNWIWGMVFVVGSGFFGVMLLVAVATLQQRMVPDYARGRVFGITDQMTMAGLLVATGVLSMLPLKHVDGYVVYILFGVAGSLVIAGLASMVDTVRRSGVGAKRCFWKHANEFYCLWFHRTKRVGPCTIPHTGPVIVVANHTSSIDPLLILTASPHRPMGFMVGAEFYHKPLIGRLIRMIGCIPVTRSGIDTLATRRALDHLREGGALGIFPEGGIPKPGEVRQPKEGAALLAIRSGAVIVPVRIEGTRYSNSVVTPLFRRSRVTIRFGRPIDPAKFMARDRHDGRGALTREIMAEILALEVDNGR